MKRIHLVLIAIVACTVTLSTFSAESFAAAANKEMTSTTAMTESGAKAKKQVPHDVNINTADKQLLTQLPGIGPVTADSILEYRSSNGQFSSIDELTQVKGIGSKTLAKLKPYLYKI